MQTLALEFPRAGTFIKEAYEDLRYNTMREQVVYDGMRVDGRDHVTVRPISIEVGFLPRTHGSTLFTRGETQAICTTTLGTSRDEQKIDGLLVEDWKRFLLHYNFPPFSVGEVQPLRGPAARDRPRAPRRARARAHAAEQGGVPVHDPHRLGDHRVERLVVDGHRVRRRAGDDGRGHPDQGAGRRHRDGPDQLGEKYAVLTDILGDEDHLGDMDFKVCGTDKGITAIQMDIKIQGLTRDVVEKALAQARDGAPARARQDERDACRARARIYRCTRRASPRSRSSPTRSARSSAPAAR